MGSYFISPQDLWSLSGRSNSPQIIDVRRHEAFVKDDHLIPGAFWVNHLSLINSSCILPSATEIVLYCVHGHQVSQSVAASLRMAGLKAQVLQGGIEAWRDQKLPTVKKTNIPFPVDKQGSLWVTQRYIKMNQSAYCWLIRRFLDRKAQFLFVEADQILAVAKETGANIFGMEADDLTHSQNLCGFDAFLTVLGLEDQALNNIAQIIRQSMTDDLTLPSQCAGLLSLSKGLSILYGEEDHVILENSMTFYDALYAFQKMQQQNKTFADIMKSSPGQTL